MKANQELEIKILDIFKLTQDKTIVVIDCQIEPMIGDYLVNSKNELLFKINGKVTHIKKSLDIKPTFYLNKNLRRSVTLSKIDIDINPKKGEFYFIKRPPIII